MIEARASKSFERCSHGAASPCIAPTDASTQRGDDSVVVWLNLVCLDAPLVAVSWQWLFAHAFGLSVGRGGALALFLTAWLIYLADRFGDSLSASGQVPLSLRQRFCRQHRVAWCAGMLSVAVLALVVISTRLDEATLRVGAAVGICALLYLILNQTMPAVWQIFPLKEFSIGFLFAAGTLVASVPELTPVVAPAWILFGCLCSLNCVSIAVWERELDLAQGRVSVATEVSWIGRVLPAAVLFVAAISVVLGLSHRPVSSVYFALAVSAILLAAVHLFRDRLASAVRTALADLVLLTPLLTLFAAAWR